VGSDFNIRKKDGGGGGREGGRTARPSERRGEKKGRKKEVGQGFVGSGNNRDRRGMGKRPGNWVTSRRGGLQTSKTEHCGVNENGPGTGTQVWPHQIKVDGSRGGGKKSMTAKDQ